MWNGSGGLGIFGLCLNSRGLVPNGDGPHFPVLNDEQTRNCLRGWFGLAKFFSVQEEHPGFHNASVC